MQIDSQSLRRHYGSLSDEELLALNPEELTEVARKCFDEEFSKRGLGEAEEEALEDGSAVAPIAVGEDWQEDAAIICRFYDAPGSLSAPHAEDARQILEEAGIPCEIDCQEIEEAARSRRTYHEYRVLVPGPLNLCATAVLDKGLFNRELEEEWRTHLAALSDDALMALSPDMICMGLRDRIARLTKAYNDEVTRRSQEL